MNVGAEALRPTVTAEVVPLNNEWRVTNVTVGFVAVLLVAASLSQRRLVVIRNLHLTNTLFFSAESCVAASLVNRGHPVPPGEESEPFAVGPGVTIFGISNDSPTEVQVLEAA